MRAKNVVISSIGILVIVGAIITVAWLLAAPSPYAPLILDAIQIRGVGNNSIEKARIVDDMDKNIARVNEKGILDKWDSLTECLNSGCSDDELFDFILSVVISKPDKVMHSKLVADVIVAGRFWGSEDILKFSKAVTASNEGVAAINSKDVDKKWEQIVLCDGVCTEKNDLVFEEIGLIVEKGLQK